MNIARATTWSLLGAYLLLPKGTEVDLPMVPPLDKVTVSNISMFFVCRFMLGRNVPLLPRAGIARWLMLMYIGSPFVTALLNSDSVIAGPTFIDGMNPYDALSAVIRQFLFILPFLLGIRFYRTEQDMLDLLLILVVACLFYTLPMLLEVRMSPQLHRWIYGYHPHSFIQQMRGDGFRPMVFIGHGLWAAFFTMTALVAATVMWRIRKPIRQYSAGVISVYLGLVLVLCKSMASLIYGMTLLLLVKLFRPKFQLQIASMMVVIALTYPITRGLDWFPVQQISEMAASVSADRAQSFDFRMRNEDVLLAKANYRPWFGWGTWGRNRIYDPRSGKDISVTDGRWIQVLGQFGWMGLVAEFGLLSLPVIKSLRTSRYIQSKRESIVMAAITLLLSINVLDLLPNNTMTPWTWLIAGALFGRVEQLRLNRKNDTNSARLANRIN